MKPISKINWMVLALISCSVLYLLNFSSSTNNYYDLEEEANVLGESLQESEDGNFRDRANFLKERKMARYKNKKVGIDQEIRDLKTEFHNLWRPVGNISKNKAHERDRVEELGRWTKRLANSRYLRYAKPKKILVFDGIENYYGTQGRLKCPFLKPQELKRLEQKCLIKEDKILGATSYLGHDAYVSVRNWKPVIFEQRIPLLQHVYYIEESPYVTSYADLAINNAILTSYSTLSDIVLPYGYFKKFTKNKTSTINVNTNYARGKTKLAAIVVSNCAAKNDRLRYVSELQKYIPIDIYGDCGPFKCDKENCFEMIRKTYKFYLAFEKANCRDYITEKFWENGLMSDVVPVVLGAHPEDYKTLAPPNSYIHVEDFANPQELANYLTLVDANPKLYNEYFAYRQIGEVINIWDQFFCRLCSILHYADIKMPPVWPEGSSWGSVNHCLPENKWYWK